MDSAKRRISRYNKVETDNQQVKKCMAALFVNFVGTL